MDEWRKPRQKANFEKKKTKQKWIGKMVHKSSSGKEMEMQNARRPSQQPTSQQLANRAKPNGIGSSRRASWVGGTNEGEGMEIVGGHWQWMGGGGESKKKQAENKQGEKSKYFFRVLQSCGTVQKKNCENTTFVETLQNRGAPQKNRGMKKRWGNRSKLTRPSMRFYR